MKTGWQSLEWLAECPVDTADPGVQAALGRTACWMKHTYDLGRRQGPGVCPVGTEQVAWECSSRSGRSEVVVSEGAVITSRSKSGMTLRAAHLQKVVVTTVNGNNMFWLKIHLCA